MVFGNSKTEEELKYEIEMKKNNLKLLEEHQRLENELNKIEKQTSDIKNAKLNSAIDKAKGASKNVIFHLGQGLSYIKKKGPGAGKTALKDIRIIRNRIRKDAAEARRAERRKRY